MIAAVAVSALRAGNSGNAEALASVEEEFDGSQRVITAALREIAAGMQYLESGASADHDRWDAMMARAEAARGDAAKVKTLTAAQRARLEEVGQPSEHRGGAHLRRPGVSPYRPASRRGAAHPRGVRRRRADGQGPRAVPRGLRRSAERHRDSARRAPPPRRAARADPRHRGGRRRDHLRHRHVARGDTSARCVRRRHGGDGGWRPASRVRRAQGGRRVREARRRTPSRARTTRRARGARAVRVRAGVVRGQSARGKCDERLRRGEPHDARHRRHRAGCVGTARCTRVGGGSGASDSAMPAPRSRPRSQRRAPRAARFARPRTRLVPSWRTP